MIVDETLVQERVQDLTIASWRVIKEEQLTKINFGYQKECVTSESELYT